MEWIWVWINSQAGGKEGGRESLFSSHVPPISSEFLISTWFKQIDCFCNQYWPEIYVRQIGDPGAWGVRGGGSVHNMAFCFIFSFLKDVRYVLTVVHYANKWTFYIGCLTLNHL